MRTVRGCWLLVLAVAFSLGGCVDRSGPPAGPDVEGEVRLSLFALGDAGRRQWLEWLPSAQRRVGAAMEAADRQRPVDAIVLLGDNFYPSGLREGELRERMAANVVRPYCRFVDLSAPRSDEVAEACRRQPGDRHPVPILAVLGNHDYRVPESPRLQTERAPDFVANWSMPKEPIAVRELGSGVSLVLLQSMEGVRQPRRLEGLAEAIRSTRGPWRILVSHHPLAPTKSPEDQGRFEVRFMQEAHRQIAESGVSVQLALAGHHHSLQLLDLRPGGPGLQVVSGSGGCRLHPIYEVDDRRFVASRHGFARVDLVGSRGSERLFVSFYAARNPWLPAGRPELLARWSVDAEGWAREEEI